MTPPELQAVHTRSTSSRRRRTIRDGVRRGQPVPARRLSSVHLQERPTTAKAGRRSPPAFPERSFARTVREDPKRKDLLYAGTETGVYYSLDGGAHWQPLQLNLPIVPITDLTVKDDDVIAATQGRSFWVLDDVTPLRETNAPTTTATRLFPPHEALRSRRGGFGRGAAGVGQNPPGGAIVTYSLDSAQDVTLEFLDPSWDADQERVQQGSQRPVRRAGAPPLRVGHALPRRSRDRRGHPPGRRQPARTDRGAGHLPGASEGRHAGIDAAVEDRRRFKEPGDGRGSGEAVRPPDRDSRQGVGDTRRRRTTSSSCARACPRRAAVRQSSG